MFGCEYINRQSTLAVRERRLLEANGGRLGVRRLAEVVVGTSDVAAAVARWDRLLAPVLSVDGVWTLAHGPRLRVVPSESERIECLVVEVESVAAAEVVFASPAASALAGLDVRFV